jgi:hypothetical protein
MKRREGWHWRVCKFVFWSGGVDIAASRSHLDSDIVDLSSTGDLSGSVPESTEFVRCPGTGMIPGVQENTQAVAGLYVMRRDTPGTVVVILRSLGKEFHIVLSVPEHANFFETQRMTFIDQFE